MGFTLTLYVTIQAVSSYLTFSHLPIKYRRLFSVALSLRFPSLDVIQHPALWSPDFPHIILIIRDHSIYSNVYFKLKYLFCQGKSFIISSTICIALLAAPFLKLSATTHIFIPIFYTIISSYSSNKYFIMSCCIYCKRINIFIYIIFYYNAF